MNGTMKTKRIKRRLGNSIIIILSVTLALVCWLQSMVFALIGNPEVTLKVGEDYLEEGATSSIRDNNILYSLDIDSSDVDTKHTGEYEVIYNILNKYNVKATITRKVTVIDVTAPEIVLIGNSPLDVIEGDEYIELGAYAIDDVDGDISSRVQISGLPDTSTIGTYTITYTITDSSGNTNTITRTVNVVGSENPVITLRGYSTEYLEVKMLYSEAGFVAMDKIDNDISDKVVITGFVDINVLGTYTLTYTVTNSKGRTATATRTVIVRDTEKPNLILNGDDVIRMPVNTSYVEQGRNGIRQL